jgi:tRNA (guanine-N7-)-methyltransferase
VWKLMRQGGLRAARCYLLYPNPAPKTSLLGRRWYAHPSFEDLLDTCASVELRTNWSIYAEEFAHALSYRLGRRHHVESFSLDGREALTPFEHKYSESDHQLFRVRSGREDAKLSLLKASSS